MQGICKPNTDHQNDNECNKKFTKMKMLKLYEFNSYENDNNNDNDSPALSILDLIGMDHSQIELKMFKILNKENKFF